MSHPDVTLTPRTRLRLACLIVEHGWACAAAAKMFMVAAKTARKWAQRYRTEGAAGMADRSSRPHCSPARTPEHLVRSIVRPRWGSGWVRSGSAAGSACPPRPWTPS